MGLAIDVGIGLVFLFALVALMCTGIQELVSSAMNLRGKTLWEGIQSMLLANARHVDAQGRPQDPGMVINQAMQSHPLIVGIVPDRFGPIGLLRWMFGRRSPTADIAQARPSYMPASTFASVLADIVGTTWQGGSRRFDDFAQAVAAMPDGKLKQVLQGIIQDADGDLAKVRLGVEAWYDATMERVGGWYKRRTQSMLLVIGLLVAGALNIDCLHVAHALLTQPALRTALVAEAEAAAVQRGAGNNGAEGLERVREAKNKLDDLRLPIGWSRADLSTSFSGILLMLAGWLITAFAASFGAPFWFDLLSKLAPMRSSGAKPAVQPSAAPAGVAAAAPAVGIAAHPALAPFRAALNDYEATVLDDATLVDLKRRLGTLGPAATTTLDQTTRDAIRMAQKRMGWPDTGELSASFVQALRDGQTTSR